MMTAREFDWEGAPGGAARATAIPADVPAFWRACPRGIDAEGFAATLEGLCRLHRPRNLAEFLVVRHEVVCLCEERHLADLEGERRRDAGRREIYNVLFELLAPDYPGEEDWPERHRLASRLHDGYLAGEAEACAAVDALLARAGLSRDVFELRGLFHDLKIAAMFEAMRRARRKDIKEARLTRVLMRDADPGAMAQGESEAESEEDGACEGAGEAEGESGDDAPDPEAAAGDGTEPSDGDAAAAADSAPVDAADPADDGRTSMGSIRPTLRPNGVRTRARQDGYVAAAAVSQPGDAGPARR